jgi:hypothetical protein
MEWDLMARYISDGIEAREMIDDVQKEVVLAHQEVVWVN